MISNNLPTPFISVCMYLGLATVWTVQFNFIFIHNWTVIGLCPVTTDIPARKVGGHQIKVKQQNRDFLEKDPNDFHLIPVFCGEYIRQRNCTGGVFRKLSN
jgi:hypothetical protein